MARIAGVNIPTNKRVIIALTYIHGIGRTTALAIADKIGIDHTRRVQDLSDAEILQTLAQLVQPCWVVHELLAKSRFIAKQVLVDQRG